MENLIFTGAAVLALILFVWLGILLPASMAEDRNRSQFGWVLVSIVGTPLLAVLLLMSLGEKDAPKVAARR